MRKSLRASLATDPHFEGHAAGSIVVCLDCWKPIYGLERGLAAGDKAGRAASAFRPLRVADLRDLIDRPDLDPVWQQLFARWCRTEACRGLLQADRPRAGSAAMCPLCGGSFLRIRTVEAADTLDRAYVLEMVTIPPNPTRDPHRWLGRITRWVADVDDTSIVVTIQ